MRGKPQPQRWNKPKILTSASNATHFKACPVPADLQPTLNKEFYSCITWVKGQKTLTDQDFVLKCNTNFFGDKRVNSGWYTPRPDFKLGDNPANLATSASFVGGTCNSCFPGQQNHSINDKARLFILGDQWIPPVVGHKGSCCPILRVNQGDLSQMKDLVIFQVAQGLRFPAGSVICIFMMAHLLRVGAHKYWQDLSRFSTWLKDTYKITVLPGISPYPLGLDPVHLVTMSQFYHQLLGASIRKGPVGRVQALQLWKPFQMTVDELGVHLTSVPAPPVQVEESSSMIYCNQEFAAGFEGDWSMEIPCTVQLTFLRNLFKSVEDYSLLLPLYSSLQSSINNNPLQGKHLFLAGTSILEDAANAINLLAAENGVETCAEFKKRDFIKHMLSLNKSHLAEASSEDTMVLSFLGNYMLDKDKADNYHPEGENVWHLVNPSIPDDTSMNRLVLDVGRILRQITSIFQGKIFLLGPIYRHLTPCCDLPEHAIKGPSGEDIDLILYTKAFSAFLHASPGIVQDRVQLIHPHEIFNASFTAESLCDGVHLNQEAATTLANFIFNLMSSKRRSRNATLTNDDFYTYLVKYKVIKGPAYNIDDAELDSDDDLDAHMDT